VTLEILTDEALQPFRHGFFTRKGGVSTGLFSGLNCGLSSQDEAADVACNREMVALALADNPKALCTVRQVHSADVVTVSDLTTHDRTVAADALVTASPGVLLGILTADCQPVLFADVHAGVIGAAHAGWRGALDGVLEATVDAMERLGARRSDISAVVGPAISQRAYEVGPEFIDPFMQQNPDNQRFFANGKGDRYQFDMTAYGVDRLRRAGVGSAHWTRHCTYSDAARFYSYRRSVHRDEPDYGRLISAIVI